MEYTRFTVAETHHFRRKVKQLLTEPDKDELIFYLSAHPGAGTLLKGTGGIRKLRWARGSKGKSGGVRVIYYFHSLEMPLYLLTIFSKNERTNISAKEKESLSKMVQQLVKNWSESR